MGKIGDKIKLLREYSEMTQSQLARKLGITRSSVNAWEMGISVPSTQYVVELANLFKVSSDYLLGLCKEIDISSLDFFEKDLIDRIITYFEINKKKY